MDAILRKLEAIEAKLDRMWCDIDFIRTHSGTYLGQGVALTHLIDERRMLVNSNDFGGPIRFISGGQYERDNVEVLLSFVRDDTATFVDAGANLGFYSLLMGERLGPAGKVSAFEPHPDLAELARRNTFINGLPSVIKVYPFGLSDVEAETDFSYPKGHLGGGMVGNPGLPEQFDLVRSRVRRLDDVLDPAETVDLMKIDVEGHEPAVLRGMQQVMARSSQLKILFENLGKHADRSARTEAALRPFGFHLYAVAGDSQLSPLAPGELANFSGYALAARPEQVDTLDRRRFSIYPSQLHVPGSLPLGPGDVLISEGMPEQTLFYGPYWFLHRGVWTLTIRGMIEGEIEIFLAERYGKVVLDQRMSTAQMQWQFTNERNLTHFEVIARPFSAKARVAIERIELVRLA